MVLYLCARVPSFAKPAAHNFIGHGIRRTATLKTCFTVNGLVAAIIALLPRHSVTQQKATRQSAILPLTR